MSLSPLRDQILVLRDAAPEATASGIVLAPDATNITDQGIVMATGPDTMKAMTAELIWSLGGTKVSTV